MIDKRRHFDLLSKYVFGLLASQPGQVRQVRSARPGQPARSDSQSGQSVNQSVSEVFINKATYLFLFMTFFYVCL